MLAATEAESVLRTLIVALGGFATVAALLLAAWNLWAWWRPPADRKRAPTSFLTGTLLLSFAGLAALTADHVYEHLLLDTATTWVLWGALSAFSVGATSLVALISIRVDRSTGP